MFVYRLNVNALLAVDVCLEASGPDDYAPLGFVAVPRDDGFDGIEDLMDMVRREVRALSGLQGHLLGETTTPADLHAALSQGGLSRYTPELIKGHDIVEDHAPEPIPPGTAS